MEDDSIEIPSPPLPRQKLFRISSVLPGLGSGPPLKIAMPAPHALLTRQFSTVPACAFAQTNPSCCDQMLSSTQSDPPMLMAVDEPRDGSEESAFESKARFFIVQDEQKIVNDT